MSWNNHYSKLVYWGSIIECIYAIRYPVTWWKWWSSGGWNVYVWKTASLLFSNLPLRFCMVHPRRPRGSQTGQVKRRDERFQTWTEEPLGTDSHRTISKRSRECWFLIGHKKCFVLLCPIGEQHLLSSFREFVHNGYYLATVARFVHQAFLTRNEGTTDESKNVSDAISRSNSICTEKILFLTDHNVS